jgi:Ca-activated chloride channel homolog
MMVKIKIMVACLCFCLHFANAQSAHKHLRNGDMLYGFGKFNQAETEYRKAEEKKPNTKSSYNLGNTLIQQERYDEAIKKYQNAASKANTPQEKAKIYHNQGNAFYQSKKYKESVEAYKQSLKNDPNDVNTKENLALARKALKQQMQQQQQDKQNQDQQKDQKEDQNQDQNDQNNQNENKDQKDQNQSDPNQKDQNQKDKQGQNQPKDGQNMTKEEARQLLEIMDNEEKKVHNKLRRIDGRSGRVKKDW